MSSIGSGPALVLVDGALCYRALRAADAAGGGARHRPSPSTPTTGAGRGESGNTPAVRRSTARSRTSRRGRGEAGGPAYVCGVSSGAALALDAAARGVPITQARALRGPVHRRRHAAADHRRLPTRGRWSARRRRRARRGGRALHAQMVGVPRIGIFMMRLMPMWSKLKARRADAAARPRDHRCRARPAGRCRPSRWASVTAPALVIAGGKSPAWMRNAQRRASPRSFRGAAAPDAARPDPHGEGEDASPPVLRGFYPTPDRALCGRSRRAGRAPASIPASRAAAGRPPATPSRRPTGTRSASSGATRTRSGSTSRSRAACSAAWPCSRCSAFCSAQPPSSVAGERHAGTAGRARRPSEYS